MAKVVNGLGRRALPTASEVKGRVLFGLGWHWSMQQLRHAGGSKPMAETESRASRADCSANGSGRSETKEPATFCEVEVTRAIARNASAHKAQ